MRVVDKVQPARSIQGKAESLFEFRTGRFGKPDIGIGGVDEYQDWGGEEGGLAGAAVGDGLERDDYIPGDVLGESEGDGVVIETRGVVAAED